MSGSRKLRNLEELHAAAQEVYALAEARSVRVALAGGLALQFYGSSRLTSDVDFLAEEKLGVSNSDAIEFGGEAFEAENGVEVDLIVRNDGYQYLYEEALARAAIVNFPPLKGWLIVRPEYMAAIKLAAGRTKDMADLEFLISENVAPVGKTRALISRLMGEYAARDFDSIVAEIDWKKSKGRL